MKKLAVLMSLLMVSASVFAQDAVPAGNSRDTYYSSGYYLGLNLGQATAAADDIASYDRKNTGFFWRVYFGYNVNHYLALDLGYLSLPTLKYKGQGLLSGQDIAISNSGYDALFSLKYPFGEGFSLYGKLGGAMLKANLTNPAGSVKQNATVWEYGGGLDYVWANIGGLHTDLDFTRIDKKDGENINVPSYDLYSVGIYYQF